MFLVSESHGLGKNKLGVNDVQYLLKTDFSPQSANFEQDNATCHGQDLGLGLTFTFWYFLALVVTVQEADGTS